MTSTLPRVPGVIEPSSMSSASPEDFASRDSTAGKVLTLLDAFGGSKGVLGVTELARHVGLPKSTAHRLLSVMVASGFVCRIGSRYALTERLFEVGNRAGSATIRATGLRRRAMPYLTELHASSLDTVHLATLSGTDVLYLEKLFGHWDMRGPTSVGGRLPAYATALGKVLLAFADDTILETNLKAPMRRFTAHTVPSAVVLEKELESVRSDGIAYDRGAFLIDMHCIAVPILDPQTNVAVAALSISSFRHRKLDIYAAALHKAAKDLGRHAAS
ncbi:IclR family transcriptional regulator [Streptomyces umbrinus]|uniref:IclR family transcriptional regulator n=1 Tax=Streptomyces umbrinus TaxID=67370 RepID=UPI00340DA472